MLLVYNPIVDQLGVWRLDWNYVATWKQVYAYGAGGRPTVIALEEVVEYCEDWQTVGSYE